jgi:deoxyribodipyrimidine photo-lyase
MLQGLAEVGRRAARARHRLRGAAGRSPDVALTLARDAALVVCDRGYLRGTAALAGAGGARGGGCPLFEVEADVVVPVARRPRTKREVAARTLRPRLHRVWDAYLHGLDEAEVGRDAGGVRVAGDDIDLSDVDALLARLRLDRGVAPVRRFRGGTSEALRLLGSFLDERLDGYAEGRSEPAAATCRA